VITATGNPVHSAITSSDTPFCLKLRAISVFRRNSLPNKRS